MAKGSHATFSEDKWEPRLCAAGSDCRHGGKIKLTGPISLWFDRGDPYLPAADVASSWHADCHPKFGTPPRPNAHEGDPWKHNPETPSRS